MKSVMKLILVLHIKSKWEIIIVFELSISMIIMCVQCLGNGVRLAVTLFIYLFLFFALSSY